MSLPPIEIPLGSIRFNSDSQKLEYWMGSAWMQIQTFSSTLDGGDRGLYGGGTSPGINLIEYITISTAGNAIDFGDRTVQRAEVASCSSKTRGVWWGGTRDPVGITNVIDFVTISSTGNASDFGDLPDNKKEICAASNETRGLCAGGGGGPQDLIHYITIASTGNSNSFGDLNFSNNNISATQNPTRAVFMDRETGTQTMDFVTIASLGDAQEFGDTTDTRYGSTSMMCSSTRGVFAGGFAPGITNLIDFITTATTGNAQNFGDLTQAGYMMCGCSSPVRGVIGARGVHPAGVVNTMDYITIASTGDAVDFGDSTTARQASAGCSNGHGGLG